MPDFNHSPAPIVELDPAHWQLFYERAGGPRSTVVDLRAVGDLMLGRGIGEVAAERGYSYPLAVVGAGGSQPLLDGDLALGNLESPLTDRQGPLRPGPYRLPAPVAFAGPLRTAGFQALALANNHALDAGPGGLADAVAALEAAGIQPLGAGPDGPAARLPRIVTVNGLRLALLAFNDIRDPADEPGEAAGWGRAWLDEQALVAVRDAANQADAVIVMVHWGEEYHAEPSARQREWAAKLTGAGATLLLGAHSHVLQPIEWVEAEGRRALVAYSLGNFLFDQGGRFETSSGAVLRLLLDSEGIVAAAAAPTDIVRAQVYPLPPESIEGRTILRTLGLQLTAAPAEPAPHPSLRAWHWDGETASEVTVPRTARRLARPDTLLVDLRGDGALLRATRSAAGLVELRTEIDEIDEAPLWHNEGNEWNVTRIAAGDPNNDGRAELLLLLWKPGEDGAPAAHPFMVGWRGGRYRVIWGGSPTQPPMQDLAIGDLDGDGRDELVVLAGGRQPGDPASVISVWRWQSWIFQQEWRAEGGPWHALALQDIDGDGGLEIVVE